MNLRVDMGAPGDEEEEGSDGDEGALDDVNDGVEHLKRHPTADPQLMEHLKRLQAEGRRLVSEHASHLAVVHAQQAEEATARWVEERRQQTSNAALGDERRKLLRQSHVHVSKW